MTNINKTILTGKQRVEIALAHGSLFNDNGPDHLVFAAGFISIGKEEVDAIKMQADQVDNCYLAVNCRSSKIEISQSLDAIKNAKYGRIAYVLPASERLCQLMLHKTQKEVLQQGIEIAKYAVDQANGVPVDVQLAASFDANPAFVAEAAASLKNEGIAIAHLGDTRGRIYPRPLEHYLETMIKNSISASSVCSTDPLCSTQEPEAQHNCVGASCHACSMLPERCGREKYE